MGSNSAFFNEIPFGCNIFGVSVPTKILKWRQKCATVGSTSSNHQSIRTKIGNSRNPTKNKIKTSFWPKKSFGAKTFFAIFFFSLLRRKWQKDWTKLILTRSSIEQHKRKRNFLFYFFIKSEKQLLKSISFSCPFFCHYFFRLLTSQVLYGLTLL